MKAEPTVRMPEHSQEDAGKTVRLPDQEQLESTATVRMDAPQQTVKMQEGEATVRMGESNATVVMGRTSSSSNGYIQIGDVLAGTYTIVKNLTYNTGEATLFICEANEESYVAKVYHQNMRPKDEVRERLRSIESNYVIPVLEDGVDAASNRYYEILPYYKKGDLTKRSSYEFDYILKVVAPSLNEGIHALHEAGVVHRDIKPNNLFFNEEETSIIIGDFGISSTFDQGSVVFTGNANRTNGYAAPEVYNRLISRESDFYSIGITLLELAMSENPFKHLTEEQIMKMTLMDELDIPASIPDQLATLIKGLTRKDRNKRWGYAEVKRWLNGEHVHLAEDTYARNIRSYRFAGKDIQSLEELTELFAHHWEEGKKHLYRGLVRDFVKQFGEEYELHVIECEEIRNQDLGLHKMIVQLHPHPPISWKGEIYEDLAQLGQQMKTHLPNIYPPIFELLSHGVLEEYVKKIGADKEYPEFYREVKNISDQQMRHQELAYYSLVFLLNEDVHFLYHDRKYTNVNEIVSLLYDQQNQLDQYSSELIEHPYFLAWLLHLGYEQQIKQWQAIV